jgi:hypothetical protein
VGEHARETGAVEDGFLEISVFDPGVGLARHIAQLDSLDAIDLESEFRYVMKCLAKHGSTSTELAKGEGLDRVCAILTWSMGFFFVRSGRLLLFRDFARDPMPYDKAKRTLDDREPSALERALDMRSLESLSDDRVAVPRGIPELDDRLAPYWLRASPAHAERLEALPSPAGTAVSVLLPLWRSK